jgi:hypothetical protein
MFVKSHKFFFNLIILSEMIAKSVLKVQSKPHLVTAALSAFVLSFVAARIFTTFFPSTVIITNGIHIHHFWYGIALLAVGGWIGISYDNKEADLVGAIIYGAGGGLIADEVGLLLTFGNYWTTLTYTIVTSFLAFITVMVIIIKYGKVIEEELAEYLRSKFSLYIAILLFAISIAFTTETTNLVVITISIVLTIVSLAIIVIHVLMRRYRKASANAAKSS